MADATKKIGKIVVDRNLCIGAATCVAVAPQTFQLDNENKAIVVNPEGNDQDTILAAAESCPVLAIYLYDQNEEQIFPKKS